MCYYGDVYYEKCGNIENHHFQTILVDYCDWKHKYRHDPEKICPTIYAEVRKLTLENDDCPVCFKEGLTYVKLRHSFKFNAKASTKRLFKVKIMIYIMQATVKTRTINNL